ncbi:MAG: glutamate synthase-related protein, partial [Planctomycetota bacterium]
MRKVPAAKWADLEDRVPSGALVENVDLVLVRYDDDVSVLYGRCLHRGALLADGHIDEENLICGVHSWDYQFRTGVSEYNNEERLHKFSSWIEDGQVLVDADEIRDWESRNPQPYDREVYQGTYADIHGTPVEPHVKLIQELAANGLEKVGHHGPVAAMGVPRSELPRWDDLQFVTAQLARVPQLDDTPVGTELVVGPGAAKPLRLEIPLIVSDMSFGALSEEAKTALARGAELAGTGICSGEGGMLPEEQEANSRYFYELASARFGFSMDKLSRVQAFHFKGGQAAKTGTGGHLPAHKVVGRIAEVRGLTEGRAAVSPSRFPEWEDEDGFRHFADEVRERTGGIPIGFKLSAQHIENDIDAALRIGVDYIILDGRGGGTGAAPLIFRDNISVPTIPALARARQHLDRSGRKDVTLFITGGLRTPADFVKALALGADGIAVSNAAIQAIGCLGMRACHTNNCPVGIATQKPSLRERLIVDESARRLSRFFQASVELMKLLARACGHTHLS